MSEEDDELYADLATSEKDRYTAATASLFWHMDYTATTFSLPRVCCVTLIRAENLMIVDLIRHDICTSSVPSSVRVSDLFKVESFQNVHQLVSTIEGDLRDGVTAIQALKSAFPPGYVAFFSSV